MRVCSSSFCRKINKARGGGDVRRHHVLNDLLVVVKLEAHKLLSDARLHTHAWSEQTPTTTHARTNARKQTQKRTRTHARTHAHTHTNTLTHTHTHTLTSWCLNRASLVRFDTTKTARDDGADLKNDDRDVLWVVGGMNGVARALNDTSLAFIF